MPQSKVRAVVVPLWRIRLHTDRQLRLNKLPNLCNVELGMQPACLPTSLASSSVTQGNCRDPARCKMQREGGGASLWFGYHLPYIASSPCIIQ